MSMILDKTTTRADLVMGQVDACVNWPAPATAERPANITVATNRFGTLDVPTELMITLPDGIIGFEQCRRFVIVCPDPSSSFRWFQSVDNGAIAFPLLNPSEFRPDYAPTIADADAAFLSLTRSSAVQMFAVITIPMGNPRGMTANLLAPIVINTETRVGKQVIIQDDGFTTKHNVLDELARIPGSVNATGGSAETRRKGGQSAHRRAA